MHRRVLFILTFFKNLTTMKIDIFLYFKYDCLQYFHLHHYCCAHGKGKGEECCNGHKLLTV